MGEVQVPADKYWGAQTQRSRENFKIGDGRMPVEIVHAFGYLEKGSSGCQQGPGCAAPKKRLNLIMQVCDEIISGRTGR
jgi:fumarate hydratase class II